MDARSLIRKHEGERTTLYCDGCGEAPKRDRSGWHCGCAAHGKEAGTLTIGVGHNLEARTLSREAVDLILTDDLVPTVAALLELDWFRDLDDVRQAVIIDMAFNMGVQAVCGFTQTIACIRARNFGGAADRMLESKWARQVGDRAKEDAGLMRSGSWPA